LTTERNLLRTLIDTAPALIVVRDREANLILVNEEMARSYRTTPDAMQGRNQMEFARLYPWKEEEILEGLKRDRDVIDSQQPVLVAEQPFTMPDGSRKWLQTAKAPLSLPGHPDCALTVAFDITEQKRLEEQLRQSQKMEAIGTLAGGVAHDFNNLLTAISGYSEFLLQALDPLSAEYGDVVTIKRSAERATDLTRQLLAFSRRQILKPRILSLNQVITDIVKMMERIIGEDVQLDVHLADGLGQVKVDPGQMEQVLMNLLVNAREAMPDGGTVTVETRNVRLDETYSRGHAEVRPGAYIALSVSDSGPGMDAETLSHIFDPFFTTKEMGTGLGLATVYGVIRQSEGHISVYSEMGLGTTFKIYLPRVDPADAAETEQASKQPLQGTETILLVEDEAGVRHMTFRALTRYGYQVLAARNGEEALLFCRQGEQKVELLLTDVVMPGGMSGPDLADRLGRIYPGLKVLYMSGYTDRAIVHHGALDPGVAFLEKPFSPTDLAGRIRDILDP
jgi:PAS domain S-box-containing protein